MKQLTLIAAVARNGVIGSNNSLLWHLPEDMKRFKALTLGHAVIMGRKTWESLPSKFRPLPGRRNIVITRSADYCAEGAVAAHSLEEAITAAGVGQSDDVGNGNEEVVFVIGGAQIYALALPFATRLELTEIDAEFDGDAHFPALDRATWCEVSREQYPASAEAGNAAYSFVRYQRLPASETP